MREDNTNQRFTCEDGKVNQKKITYSSLFWLFMIGSLIEYLASLFQEICFGTISWDYGKHFLNIGGRVSLSMSLLWGILGILFACFIRPKLYLLLKKMEGAKWRILCQTLTVFMILNLGVTSVALIRWRERTNGIPAKNHISKIIDIRYDD